MTDAISIYLDGTPERKERPQFARTKTGVRTFTRGKTKGYEMRLASAGEKAWPFAPMLCPIKLTVVAVFPIAPSWPKWKRLLASAGNLWHVGTPDIDNVVKIAMDGLNDIVWKDDKQICWIDARQQYGDVTGLWLTITPLDDTGVRDPDDASAYADDTGASDGEGAHEDPGDATPL